MPIFDYKCKCGAVKINELVFVANEKVYCDKCKAEMIKQISAPNLGGFDNLGRSK